MTRVSCPLVASIVSAAGAGLAELADCEVMPFEASPQPVLSGAAAMWDELFGGWAGFRPRSPCALEPSASKRPTARGASRHAHLSPPARRPAYRENTVPCGTAFPEKPCGHFAPVSSIPGPVAPASRKRSSDRAPLCGIEIDDEQPVALRVAAPPEFITRRRPEGSIASQCGSSSSPNDHARDFARMLRIGNIQRDQRMRLRHGLQPVVAGQDRHAAILSRKAFDKGRTRRPPDPRRGPDTGRS